MSYISSWPVFIECDPCTKFWNRNECVIDHNILMNEELMKTDQKNIIIKEQTYILTNQGQFYYQKQNKLRWVQLNTSISVKLIELKLPQREHDVVKVIRIKRNQRVYACFWSLDFQKTFQYFKRIAGFCVCQNFEQLYTIQDLLGKGGYSKVYQLCPVNRLPYQQQYYAGKIYNKVEVNSKKNLIQISHLIRQECEILKKLNSPFIITLFEIIQLDEQLILITELLRSGSLYQLLKEKVRIQEIEANGIILRIALGLQCLHNLGYVHRDIKLENVLLDKDQIKIIDFGFAEQINREVLTSGQGTIGYMAPEIFQDQPYTELGDVFSLGVVYYLLLTGKSPFRGHNQDNIMRANKLCEVDFSEYCFVNVSQKVINLVKAMLQRNPKNRISLNEVIQSLRTQNPMMDYPYHTNSVDGSQMTKQAGIRSLYLLSQNSQDSLRGQKAQQNRLNVTDKFVVKTSTFRPSLVNLDSSHNENEDLEDNHLPGSVVEFLFVSMNIMNNNKFP
ncbi:unnamed protein product [Paramecium pentaurelia]|uniref:Protein kinase domain-containing protein n=1 Tax=Paramecium pentaurelia TaxID=43138 RepID=A0A8S1Y9U7_9CILI|nr:unnamed protein product [Paramecium pentaurelia]